MRCLCACAFCDCFDIKMIQHEPFIHRTLKGIAIDQRMVYSSEQPTWYHYFCTTSLATAAHSSTFTPAPLSTCIQSLCVSLNRSFSLLTSANLISPFSRFTSLSSFPSSAPPTLHKNKSGTPPPRCPYSCAMTLQTVASASPSKQCAISCKSLTSYVQSNPTTQVLRS